MVLNESAVNICAVVYAAVSGKIVSMKLRRQRTQGLPHKARTYTANSEYDGVTQDDCQIILVNLLSFEFQKHKI